MLKLGYTLSSEEFGPRRLAGLARGAERAGFDFALISDHFHPWVDEQGESPFVWSTLGAIAVVTQRLEVGTGVTCPLIRTHPAIVAQASATVAAMMPGRFFLGVGTGENLNEHVVGTRWPRHATRLSMLEEAVAVIRELWQGGLVNHRGEHYEVENARLYTRPELAPPLLVAGSGSNAIACAGRIGDGLISLAPEHEAIETFEASGGNGKPRYGQLHVCWAPSRDEAIATARRAWPNAAIPGPLNSELALPSQFESAAALVDNDSIADAIVCGPDPDEHERAIREFEDAGFDHVYVHQVGPDQDGFFDFYSRAILPRFEQQPVIAAAGAPR